MECSRKAALLPYFMQTEIDEAARILKEACPYGHKEFIPLLIKTAQLHSDKNHDYAAGGSPLGNFERVAAILDLYPDMELDDPVVVMMIYMLKQLDAVLWHLNTDIKHKVEGPISRLEDIHVYSGLAICRLKDKEKEKKEKTMQELAADYFTNGTIPASSVQNNY